MNGDPTSRVSRAIAWLFGNRETGEITIAQFPNLSLWIFIAAALVGAFVFRTGPSHTIVGIVATSALLWWALDEVIRGANPFRRLLGAGVVIGELVLLVFR